MSLFAKKTRLLCAAALSLSVTGLTPAHAGLFDNLFGSTPACATTDRACIMSAYVQAIVARSKEGDDHPIYAAREFAQQTAGWAEDDMTAALDFFREEGLGDKFFGALEQEQSILKGQSSLSFQGIERAVYESAWPQGMEWQDFITDAVFETLYNSDDGAQLFYLWAKEQAFFEEYAKTSSVEIMYWGLTNLPEDALAYLNSDMADLNVAKRGLSNFVEATRNVCKTGTVDQANAMRQTYQRIESTQKYEGAGEFLPLKNAFMIAQHCQDPEEAARAFTRLETHVNRKLAEMEPSFETSWIYSGLADAAKVYALQFWDLGQQDAAIEILKRGVSREQLLGSEVSGDTVVDITAWDVLILGKWPEHKDRAASFIVAEMEEILELRDAERVYSENDDERFEYFANSFAPDFEICCVQRQHLEDMLKSIEKVASHRDVADASARMMELMDRYESAEGEEYYLRQMTELRLAGIERGRGCDHSEETKTTWLNQAQAQEYPKTRAEGLSAYLTYLSVNPAEDAPQNCVFQ